MFLQCLPWHSRCHLVKYSPVSGPGVLFHSKKKRRRKNMFCLLLSWYIFLHDINLFDTGLSQRSSRYIKSICLHTFLSSRGFFFSPWFIGHVSLSSLCRGECLWLRQRFTLFFLSKMQVSFSTVCTRALVLATDILCTAVSRVVHWPSRAGSSDLRW